MSTSASAASASSSSPLDGEDYFIQYMPVGMQNDRGTARADAGADDLCRCRSCDAAGWRRLWRDDADTTRSRSSSIPQKFTGLMHVDEAIGRPGSAACLAEIDRGGGARPQGYLLQLSTRFARHGFPGNWTIRGSCRSGSASTGAIGIVLCAGVNGAPTLRQGRLPAQHAALGAGARALPAPRAATWRWASPCRLLRRRRSLGLPDVMKRCLRYASGILFHGDHVPITWGGRWDYPYREAQPLIRDARDRFGAEKLMWGSDMPNVERFCTYTQSLDYLRRYCDFLPASDMDRILGDNAARLYRISAA